MGTQQEIWKTIADSNGEYQISNQGNVKSFKFGKERIRKIGLTSRGYPFVMLSIKGQKKKIRTIHSLVAMAFVENPNNKAQVNHKDGNKLNNHFDNLEWVTHQENIQHAYDTGLFDDKRKKIGAACILHHSKPVIDILTKKKYASLKDACINIDEGYQKHVSRIFKKSQDQRFFYL